MTKNKVALSKVKKEVQVHNKDKARYSKKNQKIGRKTSSNKKDLQITNQ